MGCIRGTGCHLPVLTPLPAGMIAFSRWIGDCTLSVSGKVGHMSRNSFQEYALSPVSILHETSSRERWKCGRFGPGGRS